MWLRNFLFIREGVKVPSLSDEVEALPGIELKVDGKDYYTAGDKGQVSKDTHTTESDGIDRFEVTWYRIGLTSTMKTDAWLKNFLFIREGVKLPTLSDEVEALP